MTYGCVWFMIETNITDDEFVQLFGYECNDHTLICLKQKTVLINNS